MSSKKSKSEEGLYRVCKTCGKRTHARLMQRKGTGALREYTGHCMVCTSYKEEDAKLKERLRKRRIEREAKRINKANRKKKVANAKQRERYHRKKKTIATMSDEELARIAEE